jgi:hypothetical protein
MSRSRRGDYRSALPLALGFGDSKRFPTGGANKMRLVEGTLQMKHVAEPDDAVTVATARSQRI